MEFILGVLTGTALCLAYGNYLLRQRKKDEHNRAVMKNVISAFDEMSKFKGFGITPKDMEYLNYSPPRYPLSPAHAKDLSRQLQDALDRDDFEEAARIRDLMNKK